MGGIRNIHQFHSYSRLQTPYCFIDLLQDLHEALSYEVLSYEVLSNVALSHKVLSYEVLSYEVWSHKALSNEVLSYEVLSFEVLDVLLSTCQLVIWHQTGAKSHLSFFFTRTIEKNGRVVKF